jgi:hypothetical protein
MRQVSRPFKVSIGIIGSFLGCFVFSIGIGYTVDILILQTLRTVGNESKELFVQDPLVEKNSWNYYREALKTSKNITSSQSRIRYIRGEVEISEEILQSLEDNHVSLSTLIEGSQLRHTSLPVLFRDGRSIELIGLDTLRLLAELLCVQSLVSLELGNQEESLENLFSAFSIGNHISSEALTVTDQIIGNVLISQSLRVLTIGLSSGIYETKHLEGISSFLDDLENTLPPLNSALRRQMDLLKIYISHRSITDILYLILIPHHRTNPSLSLKLFIRLVYWRYFFSPRYAFLQNFRFYDSIISEMGEIEKPLVFDSSEGKYTKFPSVFADRIREQSRRNPLPPIFSPKFTNRGRLLLLTRIRMLRLSTEIALFHRKNGSFPTTIKNFKKSISIDFNTGTDFLFSHCEDSVIIQSPAFSLEDPQDDIVIILTTKGIKKYLEKRKRILE